MKKLEIDKLEDYLQAKETRFHASALVAVIALAASVLTGGSLGIAAAAIAAGSFAYAMVTAVKPDPPIVGELPPAIPQRPAPPNPELQQTIILNADIPADVQRWLDRFQQQATQGKAEAAKWLH